MQPWPLVLGTAEHSDRSRASSLGRWEPRPGASALTCTLPRPYMSQYLFPALTCPIPTIPCPDCTCPLSLPVLCPNSTYFLPVSIPDPDCTCPLPLPYLSPAFPSFGNTESILEEASLLAQRPRQPLLASAQAGVGRVSMGTGSSTAAFLSS